jgi:C4-dicarboxylate-specific signal transduction histidine kinase
MIKVGRSPQHIDCRGKDEIDRIAVAFNDMLSELSAAREREHSTNIALARASSLTLLGTMAASIAHEINQPLSAIMANAEVGTLLLASATPDIREVNAALKEINDNALRVSEVIKHIRSLFKKDRNDRALLNIDQLLVDVLALVHGELKNHRISVESDLFQALPPVRADRIQIQQAILNLIMNAVEAMASLENRARVLRVTSTLSEPGNVLLSVQDTGSGINSKDMDRVFDAFFTTKSNGMGMGLSICRSIVDQHGGRLWAEPRTPYGSIFYLVLPSAGIAVGLEH